MQGFAAGYALDIAAESLRIEEVAEEASSDAAPVADDLTTDTNIKLEVASDCTSALLQILASCRDAVATKQVESGPQKTLDLMANTLIAAIDGFAAVLRED